jgi:hypothetical protein
MAFGCTLMYDSVVASDGHTYNRQDTQNWFNTQDTSPLTRSKTKCSGQHAAHKSQRLHVLLFLLTYFRINGLLN